MIDIEVRHKRIVANTLKHLVSDSATQNIFLLWPNLVDITERFCNFVSPLMPSGNGEPLVVYAIQLAVRAYRMEPDDQAKGRAYVIGLLESASSLSGLTVQGMKDDRIITWEPFIEPMFTWMVRNGVTTIRTSRNAKNVNIGAAKMALLVHILSAQDMEEMDFLDENLTS